MSSINLLDLVPPERHKPGAALWNRYRLEESVDGAVWTVLEPDAPLAPPVVDPAAPPTYAFSSSNPLAASVYFRVVWTDALEVSEATPPMLRPEAMPPWMPSLGDVATHIPLRTKIANGVVVGTFTNATKPATSNIVGSLIVKGVRRVKPLFDNPITDPNQAASAKDLAALYTAMLVELGLFSEQVENGQSPYLQLKELWDDATAGGTEGGIGEDGDNVTGRVSPSWKFERRPRLRW